MTKPDKIYFNCAVITDHMHTSTVPYANGTEYTRTDTIPALLAAEREKALREVFDAADKLGNHCLGCGHLCGDPDKDLEILRKSGARSCCPEREIEPLSTTLATLIDTETDPQPDLSGTSEPQASAHHIEDARVMAEYACCVIDANSQCDESACCDGRECGCGGETVHEHMKTMIRAKAGIEQEGE